MAASCLSCEKGQWKVARSNRSGPPTPTLHPSPTHPKKGPSLSKPSVSENFSASPTWSRRPANGCEAKLTFLWVHGKLFLQLSRDGNVYGSDMSPATTASPNRPSGHLGGWAVPYPAEKMLDGQHQRVDSPAYARTAHKGLLQERLEEDLCWIVPHVPPTTRSVKGLNWTPLGPKYKVVQIGTPLTCTRKLAYTR